MTRFCRGILERHNEALDAITKALVVAPNNLAVLETMGNLLWEVRHFDEAKKFLAKAHSIEIAALEKLKTLGWKDHQDYCVRCQSPRRYRSQMRV
jgi:hypothetical protein